MTSKEFFESLAKLGLPLLGAALIAQLLVDPVSLELVAGYVVDFVESLGGAAFRVENPNATAGCGCGSSFAV